MKQLKVNMNSCFTLMLESFFFVVEFYGVR